MRPKRISNSSLVLEIGRVVKAICKEPGCKRKRFPNNDKCYRHKSKLIRKIDKVDLDLLKLCGEC